MDSCGIGRSTPAACVFRAGWVPVQGEPDQSATVWSCLHRHFARKSRVPLGQSGTGQYKIPTSLCTDLPSCRPAISTRSPGRSRRLHQETGTPLIAAPAGVCCTSSRRGDPDFSCWLMRAQFTRCQAPSASCRRCFLTHHPSEQHGGMRTREYMCRQSARPLRCTVFTGFDQGLHASSMPVDSKRTPGQSGLAASCA